MKTTLWSQILPRGCGVTARVTISQGVGRPPYLSVTLLSPSGRISRAVWMLWDDQQLRGSPDTELRSIATQAVRAGAPRPVTLVQHAATASRAA